MITIQVPEYLVITCLILWTISIVLSMVSAYYRRKTKIVTEDMKRLNIELANSLKDRRDNDQRERKDI